MNESDAGGVNRRAALRGAAGLSVGLATRLASNATAAAQQATPAAGTASVPSLTIEGAQAVLVAAWRMAQRIDIPEVVAVVDAAGTLKAFLRMDGTPNSSIDLAIDKAFTAASFRAPTDQFAAAVSGDPVTFGSMLKLPHITLLAGGYPLLAGETVIGAIGCSGGTGEQDQQCSQAGVAALPA